MKDKKHLILQVVSCFLLVQHLQHCILYIGLQSIFGGDLKCIIFKAPSWIVVRIVRCLSPRFTRSYLGKCYVPFTQYHLWRNALLKIILLHSCFIRPLTVKRGRKKWARKNVTKQQRDPGQFQTYYSRATRTAQKLLHILFYTLFFFFYELKVKQI